MTSIFRGLMPGILKLYLSHRKPSKQIFLFNHHFALNDSNHTIASSLCESLRRGLNWDSLCRKYDSTNLNEHIIQKVLLEFKKPLEAKKALKFFHWVAQSKNTVHGLESYCIMIHILASARLVNDARGLLESILMRNSETGAESSLRFPADMLLSTYKMTNSCPFVFDLLVQTSCKLGMFETAFDVCCYIDEHGFSLSLVSFNTLLHVTQKSADGGKLIWKVYGHMIQKRVNPNEATVKIMIDALCKAGQLQNIVDIIDRIHGKRCSPSVIVNTSLVYRMLEEGNIQEGVAILKRMLQKNLIVDTVSYSMIVYARLKSGDLDSAREVYEEMLIRGFKPNSFVYTLFIGAYCDKGMVEEAFRLMEEMVNLCLKPYDDTYNSLIMGFAKKGDLVNCVRLCEEMTVKGLLPSSIVFNVMVEKLCLAGYMKQANETLTILMEKGFSSDGTAYTHLIDGYGREKNIQEVLKLYYEMEFRSLSPGVPVFTSLIRALCECGKPEEADKYLTIMKSRSFSATICIYESLISAYLEHGNKGRAHQLYREMLQKGLKIARPVPNDL